MLGQQDGRGRDAGSNPVQNMEETSENICPNSTYWHGVPHRDVASTQSVPHRGPFGGGGAVGGGGGVGVKGSGRAPGWAQPVSDCPTVVPSART